NVLLTSATHDHINVFPTHADYLTPFRTLLGALPADGLLVVGSEPHARALAERPPCPVVTYSLDDEAQWHAAKIERSAQTGFDLWRGTERIIGLPTRWPANQNKENFGGASAMLLERHLLSPEELRGGIASFQGGKRRMELLSPASTIPIY